MPAAPRKKKAGAIVTPIPARNNRQKPAPAAKRTPAAAVPYVGKLSNELKQTLDCLSANQLRHYVRLCCESSELGHKSLEEFLVVPGSQVVPSHKDTESEDDQYSEIESEEEEEEEEDADEEPRSKRVAIDGKTPVARWAKCENCQESFDLTENERGECTWHPEKKVVDFAADIWKSHKNTTTLGCKITKHKAEANKHVNSRFDEEDARHKVLWTKCANCGQGFDLRAEEPETCTFHPGHKTSDWDGDFWADHDENCHVMIDDFIDDSDFEDGFMWDCCEGAVRSEGCTEQEHSEEAYRQ